MRDTVREHHKAMDDRIPRRPEWDAIKSRERQASMATVIELPRQNREGGITDEKVQEIRDVIVSGGVGDREAIVVAENLNKEATARNRARAAAVRYADMFEKTDNAGRAEAQAAHDEWAAQKNPNPDDEPEVSAGFRGLRSHAVKVGEKYTAAVSVKPDSE